MLLQPTQKNILQPQNILAHESADMQWGKELT